MTDRIRHLTVTLDADYRDDELAALMGAIMQIRSVESVEPIVAAAIAPAVTVSDPAVRLPNIRNYGVHILGASEYEQPADLDIEAFPGLRERAELAPAIRWVTRQGAELDVQRYADLLAMLAAGTLALFVIIFSPAPEGRMYYPIARLAYVYPWERGNWPKELL